MEVTHQVMAQAYISPGHCLDSIVRAPLWITTIMQTTTTPPKIKQNSPGHDSRTHAPGAAVPTALPAFYCLSPPVEYYYCQRSCLQLLLMQMLWVLSWVRSVVENLVVGVWCVVERGVWRVLGG